MVRLRYQTGDERRDDPNHYWKLESGYGVVSPTNTKEENVRNDEEQLKAELRFRQYRYHFTTDRERAANAERVTYLETADDDFTTNRFDTLPPELRTIIHEFYFASLADEPLGPQPRQPPITLASRLMRSESLPIFHSHCRFNASFTNLIYSTPTKTFLETTTDTNIACIRHLLLTVEVTEPKERKFTIRIDLSGNDEANHHRALADDSQARVETNSARADTVLSHLLNKQGVRKFEEVRFERFGVYCCWWTTLGSGL